MPLPHFLLLILSVILAAALTLWASFAIGVPALAFLIMALSAAAIVHFGHRGGHDHDG